MNENHLTIHRTDTHTNFVILNTIHNRQGYREAAVWIVTSSNNTHDRGILSSTKSCFHYENSPATYFT